MRKKTCEFHVAKKLWISCRKKTCGFHGERKKLLILWREKNLWISWREKNL